MFIDHKNYIILNEHLQTRQAISKNHYQFNHHWLL